MARARAAGPGRSASGVRMKRGTMGPTPTRASAPGRRTGSTGGGSLTATKVMPRKPPSTRDVKASYTGRSKR